MSCRSQPPLHFSQHSITPLQAIFSLINTSSSGAELSLLKAAVTCQCYRLCTSIDPCWVMVQCSVDPQTSSLKTPPWYVISHCRNSGFSTNVRRDTEILPQTAFGGRSGRSPFFGSGCQLLEPALSCHIPSPSQNSCQTDIAPAPEPCRAHVPLSYLPRGWSC